MNNIDIIIKSQKMVYEELNKSFEDRDWGDKADMEYEASRDLKDEEYCDMVADQEQRWGEEPNG
jgi:tripartite-type tricarboxylate transporter receptor subunit TctC|tara:strand:- start:3566 stop:3757 length:192 start_codon:yes stop_codon:yes gene_type:complete